MTEGIVVFQVRSSVDERTNRECHAEQRHPEVDDVEAEDEVVVWVAAKGFGTEDGRDRNDVRHESSEHDHHVAKQLKAFHTPRGVGGFRGRSVRVIEENRRHHRVGCRSHRRLILL